MEEEGPEPMRDLQPAPKNPNSADQFREIHEADYEARARSNTDKVREVHEHNMAYPKLIDELSKRKSALQMDARDPKIKKGDHCNACAKLRQLEKLQKLKIKPKCKATGKRSKSRKMRSRVRKNRRQKTVRIREPKCKWCNLRNIKYHSRSGCKRCHEIIDGSSDGNSEKESVVNSHREPDTSVPSLSSYNSYPSLEHEPLVDY